MLESFTCVPLTHTMAGRHKCCSGNMSEDDWRWHMYDTVKVTGWVSYYRKTFFKAFIIHESW